MPVVDELLISRALGLMWYTASVLDSEVTRIEMGGRRGDACDHRDAEPPAPSRQVPETATAEVEETSGMGVSVDCDVHVRQPRELGYAVKFDHSQEKERTFRLNLRRLSIFAMPFAFPASFAKARALDGDRDGDGDGDSPTLIE